MEKKGQASMEFLMTYGWAILAAVLAISVLAYYGVFNPGSSLPEICQISAPLGCAENKVNTSHITLILRNGAGSTVDLQNVSVTGCTDYPVPGNLVDGSTANVYIACTNTLDAKFNGDIVVTYLEAGKTITKTSTGDIRAQVVAA